MREREMMRRGSFKQLPGAPSRIISLRATAPERFRDLDEGSGFREERGAPLVGRKAYLPPSFTETNRCALGEVDAPDIWVLNRDMNPLLCRERLEDLIG